MRDILIIVYFWAAILIFNIQTAMLDRDIMVLHRKMKEIEVELIAISRDLAELKRH